MAVIAREDGGLVLKVNDIGIGRLHGQRVECCLELAQGPAAQRGSVDRHDRGFDANPREGSTQVGGVISDSAGRVPCGDERCVQGCLEGSVPPISDSSYLGLARDAWLNSAGYIVAALAGLLLVPVLIRGLGSEAYGVLVVGTTVATLGTVPGLALATDVTRQVAGGAPAAPAWFPFAVTGLAGAAAISALGFFLEAVGFAGGQPVAAAVTLLALGFLADQLAVLQVAVLSGRRRFDLTSGLLAGTAFTRALGAATLIALGARLEHVAAWYALVSIVSLALHLCAVRAVLRPHERAAREMSVLRPRLRSSGGSLMIMTAVGATWFSGPLAVAAVGGASAGGLFQASQRLGIGLLLVPDRIAATLYPAAGAAQMSDRAKLRALLADGTRLTILVVVPLVTVLLAGAPEALHVWLGDVPVDAPLVLRLTTMAVAVHAVGAPALQAMWGRGHVLVLARLCSAAVAVAVIGALAGVTAFGPTAAAAALVAAALVTTVGALSAAAREARCRPWAIIGLRPVEAAAVIGACASAAIAILALQIGSGGMRLIALLVVTAAAYAGAVMALGRELPERRLIRALLRRGTNH